MSQPFIVSMKLVGDSSDAVAATTQAEQALDRLGATASGKTAPALRMEAQATAEADRALEMLQSTIVGNTSAAQSHALALGTEAGALRTAEMATKAYTGASRAAAAQRANLVFQLNDIAVSLASGMNPLMVAAQQGSQIAGIYGGQGGLGKALTETAKIAGGLVTRLWPVGAAAAAVGVSFAALTTEINRAGGQQVTFGDTIQATMDLALGAVSDFIAPVVQWFGELWDTISPGIAGAVIGIVQGFDLAFRDIKTTWSMLPVVLGDFAISTANGVLGTIEGMVNGAIGLINDMTAGARDALKLAGFDVGTMAPVKFQTFDNPFSGAAGSYGDQLVQNQRDVMGTDYLGILGNKAREVATNRLAEEAKAKGGTSGAGAPRGATDDLKALALDGMGALTDATRAASEEMDFYRGTFGGFISEAWQGLKNGENAFSAFGEAGANALDKISERFLSEAANGLFNMLLGSLFGPVGGVLAGGVQAATGYVPGFGAYGQFAGGGWTAGRRNEVAGLVHGEEFVVKAGPAAANRGMLEAMNAGYQVKPSAPETVVVRPGAMAASSSIAGSMAQAYSTPSNLPAMNFTTNITIEGTGADAAGMEQRFGAAMDERDRRLKGEVQDLIEAHLENPMRRW